MRPRSTRAKAAELAGTMGGMLQLLIFAGAALAVLVSMLTPLQAGLAGLAVAGLGGAVFVLVLNRR